MFRPIRILAPLLALTLAPPVLGHEFWLSPQAYRIAPGEAILTDIRVGQEFEGPPSVYIPRAIARFDMVTARGTRALEGRLGDRPAGQIGDAEEGLLVLVHETTDAIVNYTDFDKFADFARHKDFAWAIEDHRARGLNTDSFRETYRRYAKTLIAVGDGAGQDRRTGLDFELVALANPYTDDLSGGMPVQLWHLGAPLPDTQIELFAKDSAGAVTITLHRTDADGVVRLPMRAATEYLVDSVLLEPRDPETDTQGAVWHSKWAALTFQTPQADGG